MDVTLQIPDSVTAETLQKILRYLGDVKYGSVTLILHDGKVVQVEKQEKIKLV
jgi:hypothetical protein